jgi:ElaB/YqjD/DUF883 family membrane-anchored ribosome-binding protein
MNAINRLDTAKREFRQKVENAIETSKEVCERLQKQTAAAAKATDKVIRGHPYQAAGIAFGVGALIAVLAMRSRRG